jgi:DNA polymerase-3 subunit delta
MALHKRTAIAPLLEDIRGGRHKQIYLLFGERFLCQQVGNTIEQEFLNSAHATATIHSVDGSTEDNSKIVSRTLSYSLLPGIQLLRVVDCRLFLSRSVGSTIWDKAVKAHQNNKPTPALRHLANLLSLGSVKGEGERLFSEIAADQWQKLFGFSHPDQDLSWADSLIRENPHVLSKTGDDAGEKLIDAIKNGIPPTNILLISAENVDKRKKIFSSIKKFGEIIDCSIAEGASRAARNEQKDVVREMALQTLTKRGKTIEPKALEMLFDRIGFHPVAVVMETEKLALFVDERERITSDDLDQMVGRTREDAIFELTEAFGQRDTAKTVITLNHLLEDGVHELAVIASLRNYLRRMLIFRALQQQPSPLWHQRISAGDFQNNYLPALKETGAWPKLLKGHPYALYMGFNKAAEFSIPTLKHSLTLLLEAEFRLKSSPLPRSIVLEELLISLIRLNQSAASTS